MKKKTYILILLSCSFFLTLVACEEIEFLAPPTEGEIEKNGSGNSDAKSILFVLNETSTIFVNPISAETYIVTDETTKYLANDQFAKPLDQNKPTEFSLDIFPTLKKNDFLKLQDPIENLEKSEYPGAFGTTISPNWAINSNWWKLEPQKIDYGYNSTNVEIITGRISTNTTWTNDKKYLLRGQVFVDSGVTLTIKPGTIIFGEKAVGIQSGVLAINRGAKLIADGTPDMPIIFTGTSKIGERTRGQWGGIVLCGKAKSNKGDNVLIEGIQGTNSDDGKYGGNEPTDNSGSMSYVRIEYAGIAVSPGNELNSLTLGGVGSGTSIHHIIVTYAGDDALEWFGGSVNLKYISTYNTLDDDLDMDAGYNGNIQYVYLVRNPFSADESGSAMLEVSSSKSVGTNPQTSAKISNATLVGTKYQLKGTTLIGDPKYQGGMYSKEDAKCLIINSVFIGTTVGVQNP